MNNINRNTFEFYKELDDYHHFLAWKARFTSNHLEITSTKSEQINLSENFEKDASEILLLTPEETAIRLSVSRSSVYELISNGSLESVTIGRSRRIPSVALKEFVERLRAGNSDQLSNLKSSIMYVPEFELAKLKDKASSGPSQSTNAVGA